MTHGARAVVRDNEYDSSADDPRVAVARVGAAAPDDAMRDALRRLAGELDWAGASDADRGAFGGIIAPGARVVVKPNWVLHANHGPWGTEPLYTDPRLVRLVVEEALRAGPSRVIAGDAPLQSCDFDRLMSETGLRTWANSLAPQAPAFGGLLDFRRTRCVFENGIRQASEDQIPLSEFVLFDLGAESLLEPITDSKPTFRVTQYDPQKLGATHRHGRHQYLIAREIIAADVVINLPKLKTHKKAGITCALKNLIGINGNKEYLPHHRIGGSEVGGDCYPGRSPAKRALEFALDRLNSSAHPVAKRSWNFTKRVLDRVTRGDELGVEGAWHGNDTIWRTCLDLNRILMYGRLDGTLADVPQRRVVSIADAMIAGQGDGPLSPEPVTLGMILAGANPAAVDWVGSQLLGYDAERIPISTHAFDRFRWPLTSFAHAGVTLTGDLGDGAADVLLAGWRAPLSSYPVGWRAVVRPSAR